MKSVNPFNGQLLYEFEELNEPQINQKIEAAHKVHLSWKNTTFSERSILMHEAANVLRNNKEDFGKIITLEMGKPITQAIAEVEKCAWVCEYYAHNAEDFLKNELIETDAIKSYVSYEPLGVVFAVMPWNYPFWQVFRFAAPGLMAGNTAILKHASNVMKCGETIQKVFELAGFPKDVFINLPIKSDKVENIIKNPLVKAVTLTGSKPAGSMVASTAAKEIKKSVLELGGNNAFIVCKDADLEKAVSTAVNARYQNTGQSCIAAKRLLLHEAIADEFLEKYINAIKEKKSGDPLDEETYIGVMAREDLAKELESQVNDSVAKGAKVLLGGKREKAYFEPTVLTNVTEDMPVFKEETFGPVIAVVTFKTLEEAITISNNSDFGLGVSIFTKDIAGFEAHISKFNEGAVFVNDMVKSDPRLPFGGVKISGFGRELSHHGIKEFVNMKTVYIN
ncbi:succinate-semialdehyde dehydrogenase / glutarate-semialdehyde dehydrogenase [Pustulibacterium marinum]|uniref:Succinate-semialdehyde dehydrogenase / glutarate-semialdehyde dehydrogenase n=2 Tax=Pustulibacterium marinum TaxID=1224947 RepID=A0A1I7I0K2_9FLAO|nr:succinate-semialdehyde dehydrogenase / glutarate-semialdehyde dehydrogenase [Pustulibacterium marinum]